MKTFRFIIVIFACGIMLFLSGEKTLEATFHAARLRAVKSVDTPKSPVMPSQAKAGDIVLIAGQMVSSAPVVEPGEPAFPNVFKVKMTLNEKTGLINKKWHQLKTQTWISKMAKVGPWNISSGILQIADGGHSAIPLQDFQAPRKPGVTEIEANREALEYTMQDRRLSVTYDIWTSGQPYTVLARVEGSEGNLVPFEVKGLSGAPFAVLTPGTYRDLKFLDQLALRDALRAILFGSLAWFPMWVLWGKTLRRLWDITLMQSIVASSWRAALCVLPVVAMAAWPSDHQTVIWAVSLGLAGVVGMLVVLGGKEFVEWIG